MQIRGERSMRVPTRLSVLAAVVAVATALVACSNSKITAVGGQGTTVSAGSPIKLLAMGIYEGPASVPERLTGVQAAAAAINAAGGIKGHKIEIISCNTGLTTLMPTGESDCARKGVDGGALAAVATIAGGGSGVKLLSQAGIPSIGSAQVSSEDLTDPLSFPFGAGPPNESAAMSRLLQKNGATKLTVAAFQIASSATLKDWAAAGVKGTSASVSNLVLIPGSPSVDYSPYVAQLLAGGTDGMVLALNGDALVKVVLGAVQAGYKGAFVAGAAYLSPSVVSQLSSVPNPIYGVADYDSVDSTSPAILKFVQEMKAYNASAVIDQTSLESWAAMHFVADRLATLSSLSSKALADSLPGSTVDLAVAPPFKLTPNGQFPGMRNVFRSTVQYEQVQAGKLVTLYDGKFFDQSLGV